MTGSLIYRATVAHTRHRPVVHAFRYPLYLLAIDLDDLPILNRTIPLFGYNRHRPVSLRDTDYLEPGPDPIRIKLERLLANHSGLSPTDIGRIILVTMARVAGRVFNPASFYYLYTPNNTLAGVVTEVNNTFGEKHVYILAEPSPVTDFPACYRAGKAFHVSPFFDRSGTYEFQLSDIRQGLDIRISLADSGGPALTARLWSDGPPRPLTSSTLLRTLVRYPLSAALTMPRIIRQAASLYFSRRLAVYPKPDPASTLTIRRRPLTLRQRLGRSVDRRLAGIFIRYLEHLERGTLEIRLPDGTRRTVTGGQAGLQAQLNIHDHRFFRRVARSGDIGFGEAFTAGLWDSPDPLALLRLLAENRTSLAADTALPFPSPIIRGVRRLRRLGGRRNTRRGSRANIHAHYDLGDPLFALFLDSSMTYSSAVFENPDDSAESLAAAQQRKFRRIIAKAGIGPGERILEIGCGWGGFALAAARITGCHVTAVTVSEKQYRYTRQRVEQEGLTDRISVRLADYRDIDGHFDRIVSIEMLEAVGHRYHPAFFRVLDHLLKPGGTAVLQFISINDQRYDSYRREGDWIRKHIFPGGLLPSLTRVCRVVARHTHLVIRDVEDIGRHYARTLAAWRSCFLAGRDRLEELGYDRVFQRTWEYYFTLCEAGFRSGHISNLQIVLNRPTGAPVRATP